MPLPEPVTIATLSVNSIWDIPFLLTKTFLYKSNLIAIKGYSTVYVSDKAKQNELAGPSGPVILLHPSRV